MKTIPKIYLLISAVVFSTLKSNAQQNTFPILSTSIETECVANCIGIDSLEIISDSSEIEVTMTINLFEEIGISKIQVKLGMFSGGFDLVNKTFDFDVFGNVGDGCSYYRSGNLIILGLGRITGLLTYFSEVIIERTDQTVTDAVVFNR